MCIARVNILCFARTLAMAIMFIWVRYWLILGYRFPKRIYFWISNVSWLLETRKDDMQNNAVLCLLCQRTIERWCLGGEGHCGSGVTAGSWFQNWRVCVNEEKLGGLPWNESSFVVMNHRFGWGLGLPELEDSTVVLRTACMCRECCNSVRTRFLPLICLQVIIAATWNTGLQRSVCCMPRPWCFSSGWNIVFQH